MNSPNPPEFGPEDFQFFCSRRPQQSSPARVALQLEDISDSDDIEEPENQNNNKQKPEFTQPPSINSAADLAKLVSRKSTDSESDTSENSKSSAGEDDIISETI